MVILRLFVYGTGGQTKRRGRL